MKCKKITALLLALTILLSLTACGGTYTDSANACNEWTTSFQYLLLTGQEVNTNYAAAVYDLIEVSAALETIDASGHPDSEAFLKTAAQFGRLILSQADTVIMDLPNNELAALLTANNALLLASMAKSDEEFFTTLDRAAAWWLDAYVEGSSGYVIPVEHPVEWQH